MKNAQSATQLPPVLEKIVKETDARIRKRALIIGGIPLLAAAFIAFKIYSYVTRGSKADGGLMAMRGEELLPLLGCILVILICIGAIVWAFVRKNPLLALTKPGASLAKYNIEEHIQGGGTSSALVLKLQDGKIIKSFLTNPSPNTVESRYAMYNQVLREIAMSYPKATQG